MSDLDDKQPSGVSRRDFLKISGLSAAVVPMVAGPTVLKVAGEEVEVHGPDAAPITLMVNGKRLSLDVEPRVTLLDALREHLDITGPKRVCDRGECGACTVLLDGHTVYSCSTLAIEAQGKTIVTAEGLGTTEQPHPIQASFVEHDAQQCGFCTPGFTVSTKHFLDKHGANAHAQIAEGMGGNFCRCGTYRGIHEVVKKHAAAAPAAAAKKGGA